LVKQKIIMAAILKYLFISIFAATSFYTSFSQTKQQVKIIKSTKENKVDIFIGDKLFTSFLYPGSLEKPVFFPVYTASGAVVTRGFPLNPQPGDPNDHPHHIGMWFTFENVNGLDFWNNSYAIPAEKKHSYGWIKTDRILDIKNGAKGILSYHANWVNQHNENLLEETTGFEFSGTAHQRIIDRTTTLKASTDIVFTDAKDGLLGIRVAHTLQLPTDKDQEFTDNKGNVTIVKGGTDKIAGGNYLSSEGRLGDSVWSSRAAWCKIYGKIENDSVSVTIIDHPQNPNYPTFWHARGYGLFAANPLGEKIFTNGKSAKNLPLKKGEAVTFRYRIIIDEGKNTITVKQIDEQAGEFAEGK
jgi:Methane oxygenase PmoA